MQPKSWYFWEPLKWNIFLGQGLHLRWTPPGMGGGWWESKRQEKLCMLPESGPLKLMWHPEISPRQGVTASVSRTCYVNRLYIKVKSVCVQLFATPWLVACQAPLSMEFSRQEYWSGGLFFLQGIRTSKFIKEDKLRYGLLQRTVDDLEKEGNFIWLGKSWIQYDAFLKIRVLSK